MKKKIKLILIITGIILSIIILDTIQARILKNSPLISKKEQLPNNASWVDKGILMDTYYCIKEKDIVTVSWHFKTTKFTCPIDNTIEENNLENISIAIKEGTLTKTGAVIIITDLNEITNTYNEFFRIDKKEQNKWIELTPIINNYGFNEIGYFVDKNNKLELEHNWKWLYGSLDKGKYRLVKEENNKYFFVQFKIDN